MKNISAKKIGIITGVVMIICALLMYYALKLPETGTAQFLLWSIYSTGIILSLVSYKNNFIEEHSFKQFFSRGFKTFIISALLIVIYTFIFYKLNPGIMENAIKVNNALIQKEGNRTPPEIQANAEKFRSIFIPGMLMMNTVIYLVIGSVVSLIGSGFFSQKIKS